MGKEKFKTVTIYTDGGCDPNPGAGAWAAILLYGKNRKEIFGTEPDTTNNRMEMTAAIKALLCLKEKCIVNLYTDSEYLKKGITQWLAQWKKRNWARKGGSLKNVDLWKQLDEEAARHNVHWHWIRGHNGIRENERCDQLVNKALGSLKNRILKRN